MVFETMHLAGLAFSFIVIVVADRDGWLYFSGKKQTLNTECIKRYHQLAWLGLGTLIVSGAFLLMDEPEAFSEPLFYAKMAMVLALVINGVFIGSIMKVASETPFADLNQRQKLPLLLSGVVSVSCWVGAAAIGFLR